MKIIDMLKYLGLDVILLLAGFAGGIASLTKSTNLTKWQKFISVMSGGFAANYLTPVVGRWLDLGDDVLYGVGFLLGYGGLKAVETIYLYFINKFGSKQE